MSDELEKIDQIRGRLGVSYKEAKEALDAVDGDVVKALMQLEEERESRLKATGEFPGWEKETASGIREIIDRGVSSRLRIKKEGRTVAEVPAVLGVLGILGILVSSELAVIAAAGSLAALSKKYSLELDMCRGGETKFE